MAPTRAELVAAAAPATTSGATSTLLAVLSPTNKGVRLQAEATVGNYYHRCTRARLNLHLHLHLHLQPVGSIRVVITAMRRRVEEHSTPRARRMVCKRE